jgi:hypothetical protein
MSKGSWIRGAEADKIIQMAAAGTESQIIGDETGHRREVIDNFISRHRVEVEALVHKHAMQLDQYWLTIKAARIGKAQERHVILTEQFHEVSTEWNREDEPSPTMIKLSDALLRIEREAGEEAGQLVTRMPNPGPDPKPVQIIIDRPIDG